MRKIHLLWILPFGYLFLFLPLDMLWMSAWEFLWMFLGRIVQIILPASTATLIFYIISKRKTATPVLLLVGMIVATFETFFLLRSYHSIPIFEKWLNAKNFVLITLTIALPYSAIGYLFRKKEFEFDELKSEAVE